MQVAWVLSLVKELRFVHDTQHSQQNQTKQGAFSTAKREDERRQCVENGKWVLETDGQGGTLRGWPRGWDLDVEEERMWRLLVEGMAMQGSRGEREEAYIRPREKLVRYDERKGKWQRTSCQRGSPECKDLKKDMNKKVKCGDNYKAKTCSVLTCIRV